MIDPKKMETAIILARMYGVKETLESLPLVSNEDFVSLITERAEEYLNTGTEDIVSFFECRFCTYKT